MRERVAKRIKGDRGAKASRSARSTRSGLKLLQIEHAQARLAPRLFDLRQRRQQRASSRTCCRRAASRRDRRAAVPGLAREERRPVAGAGAGSARQSAREREAAALYARYQAAPVDVQRGRFRRPDPPAGAVARGRRRGVRGAGANASATCWSTNARTPTTRSTACSRRSPARRGDFTCVGDDDQSIYAWRGANPDNLLQLAQRLPAAEDRQARTELPLHATACCARRTR